MPKLTPYTLSFHGGMRVGTRGVNLEEAGLPVPADTLFAALVDAYRRAGYDPQDLLSPFLQAQPDPPFLISSAFPFAGEVRFFPMPVDPSRLFSRGLPSDRGKEVKRIRCFSQALFEKALAGEPLDGWLFPESDIEEPQRGAALQGGALWLTVDEIDKLPGDFPRGEGRRHALRARKVWAEDEVPRVTVDRLTAASTIYHSGRISFAKGCGLWFGVHWRKEDERMKEVFARALAVLEDDGLGGERSSGYGAFCSMKGESFSLPDAAPGQLAFLLSRYHPRSEELPAALSSPQAAYQLDAVGGWLKSPDGPAQRRKRVRLVSEGSLVALPNDRAGGLADVTPMYNNPLGDLPHRVYRYGMALAAAWPQKEEAHA